MLLFFMSTFSICSPVSVGAGEVLAREETKQIKNHYACISPCGRFVACTGNLRTTTVVFYLHFVLLRVYT